MPSTGAFHLTWSIPPRGNFITHGRLGNGLHHMALFAGDLSFSVFPFFCVSSFAFLNPPLGIFNKQLDSCIFSYTQKVGSCGLFLSPQTRCANKMFCWFPAASANLLLGWSTPCSLATEEPRWCVMPCPRNKFRHSPHSLTYASHARHFQRLVLK